MGERAGPDRLGVRGQRLLSDRYEVVVSRPAEKALVRRIAPQHADRIRRAIEDLAGDPRPQGARRMRGTGAAEERRVAVGRDYRVVYRIEEPHPDHPEPEEGEPTGLVTVLAVGHRQGIYG
ncbi:MAG: type II toxin-antitoxin system RelE/ParE family toxin [Actinomycetota bacterium]|nr:type II toxin-antitoxin system RelE/ParE family toxin [Actinomycetota bacterium]